MVGQVNIGLLCLGEMGASIAAVLRDNGHRIHWIPAGRSEETKLRAKNQGLRPLADLGEMGARCQLIVSICPPHLAEEIAIQVAASRFSGQFLEANAISPQKSIRIEEIMIDKGISYVDGSIIGPPFASGDTSTTILFLSGAHAQEVEKYFSGGLLKTWNLGIETGLASAMKMCDSVFNKGLLALLYETISLAESFSLRRELMRVWSLNEGGVAHASVINDRLNRSARKAHRFVGEMDEVADTLAACPALPVGLATEARDIYAKLAGFKPGGVHPSEEAIVAAILSSK
jgi:3-hydroxyisobutyrate dehydrogenase-like beta-hydroxyacid dehydrogenase